MALPCMRAILLASALLSACAGCHPARTRGWECIAPANPGGGWDLTCRLVAQVARELELSPVTMRVTNLPGAGGGVAFAHTVSLRATDSNLIVAASPATALRLAQGQFARFRAEDVRWLAALGAEYGVLAVANNAPWRDLTELLNAWQDDARRVVVGGGSAVAGQDHMKVLVLAHRAGLDVRRIRYVPFDGGGEALTALLGGFIQVFSGDASEIEAHVAAGGVRAIGVLAPQRLSGTLSQVPTAREQGYDVEWITWRGFYVPGNISDQAYARWADLMSQIARSPAWIETRDRYGIDSFVLMGQEFESFVHNEVRLLRELSQEIGLIP